MGYSDNQINRIKGWYRQQADEFAKSTGPIRDGNLIVVLPSQPQRDAKLTAGVMMFARSAGETAQDGFVYGQFQVGGVTHFHPIFEGGCYPIIASNLDQFRHFRAEVVAFAHSVLGLKIDFTDAVDLNLICVISLEFPMIEKRARLAADPVKLGAQLRADMQAYVNEFVAFHEMWHAHTEDLLFDWTRQPVVSSLMH